MAVNLSRYLSAAEVKVEFGLGYPPLSDFRKNGFIRTIKFGESKQATRLYRTEDVLDCLDRMASGYEPKRQKIEKGGRK